MITHDQALHLLKVVIYHSILFLIYSFIHPRFNINNIYYFPLALFIYNFFNFSLTKTKKEDESRVDTGAFTSLYLFFKFIFALCFLLYCVSDIFLAKQASINDLRVILDFIFVCLIFLGPIIFFKDVHRSSELERSATADDSHENSIISPIEVVNATIQTKPDKMVECINCNFSIKNPSTNLCPNCGSDIYTKSEYTSCKSCGSEYDNSADSCPYCGHIPSL